MSLLTPDEALTRQCRICGVVPAAAQVARALLTPPNAPQQQQLTIVPCAGPGCAHWRWAVPPNNQGEESRGFCGLAGAPLVELNQLQQLHNAAAAAAKSPAGAN